MNERDYLREKLAGLIGVPDLAGRLAAPGFAEALPTQIRQDLIAGRPRSTTAVLGDAPAQSVLAPLIAKAAQAAAATQMARQRAALANTVANPLITTPGPPALSAEKVRRQRAAAALAATLMAQQRATPMAQRTPLGPPAPIWARPLPVSGATRAASEYKADPERVEELGLYESMRLTNQQIEERKREIEASGEAHDPLISAVRDPIGAAKELGKDVIGVAAWPQRQIDLVQSEDLYRRARGLDRSIWGEIAEAVFRSQDPYVPPGTPHEVVAEKEDLSTGNWRQAVIVAYERGEIWDENGNVIARVKPGPEAVLALRESRRGLLGNLVHQMATDPLMLTGASSAIGKGAMNVGRLVRTADNASLGARAVGLGAEGAGLALRAPAVADLPFEGAVRAAKAVNKAAGSPIRASQGQMIRDAANDIADALHRWRVAPREGGTTLSDIAQPPPGAAAAPSVPPPDEPPSPTPAEAPEEAAAIPPEATVEQAPPPEPTPVAEVAPDPPKATAATAAAPSGKPPRTGWSITPKPGGKGAKDRLPPEQWQAILDGELDTASGRMPFRQWAEEYFEPAMDLAEDGASGADQAIARARYELHVRGLARRQGIEIAPFERAPATRNTTRGRTSRILADPDWESPSAKRERHRLYQAGLIDDRPLRPGATPIQRAAHDRYQRLVKAHADLHGIDPADARYWDGAKGAQPGQVNVDLATFGVSAAVRYARDVRNEIRDIVWEARRAAVPGDVPTFKLADKLPDASPVGIAANMGRIDADTYEVLTRQAAVEPPTRKDARAKVKAEAKLNTPGEVIDQRVDAAVAPQTVPVWKLYDDLVADGMSEGDAIRETIRRHIAHAFPEATPKQRSLIGREIARALRAMKRVLGGMVGASREAILYNPARALAGINGDILYDAWHNAVNGDLDAVVTAFSPRSYRGAFRAVRGNDAALRTMPGAEWLDQIGAGIPDYTMPVIGRDETSRTGETLWRQGFDATIGQATGGRGGAVTGVVASRLARDFRTAGDTTRRWALHLRTMEKGYGDKLRQFRVQVERRALALGKDPADFLKKLDEMGQDFSPEDVLRAFGGDRLARDWRAHIRALEKDARALVEDRLFSYRKSNLDEALGKVLFFHYWQSRALWNHGRTVARNPWLLTAYANIWDHAQEEAERNGYPPSLRGFIAYMGDEAGGFFSLFNPLGLLTPYAMFMEMANQNGEAGWWERWGRQFVFINPWMEAGLQAMGVVNSPFVADPSGTFAMRNAVKSVVNWMRAHDYLGMEGGPAVDPVDQGLRTVVSFLSTQASKIVPWSEPNVYGDPRAYDLVAINGAIEDAAVETWGPREGWTEDQWEQVALAQAAVEMGNPAGHPLAAEGFQRWADAAMEQTGRRMVVPGQSKLRHGPTLARNALADEGWAALDMGDEPTPAQQAAMRAEQMATASPEGRTLGLQADQYRAIGTDFQRDLHGMWVKIAYQPDQLIYGVSMPDGTYLAKADLIRMSEDDRLALADAFVEGNGWSEDLAAFRDERDAFIAAHPEYQSYDKYVDALRDGGVREMRLKLEADHPEFADEIAKQRARHKGKDAAVIEKELDEWATSRAAYLAFAGKRASIYDEDPEAAYDPSADPWAGLPITSEGGGGSKKADPAESLTKKVAKYEAEIKIFERLYGFDPRTNHNPFALKAHASVIPTMPQDVETYYAWREMMRQTNPGADVSVRAFVAFMEQLERQAT